MTSFQPFSLEIKNCGINAWNLEKIGVDDDARRAQALGMKAAVDEKRAGMVERRKDYQSALDQMLMDALVRQQTRKERTS